MLIEQYVTSLQAEDLNAAYDRAARNLFVFLREYGCSNDQIALACSIIQQHTGYHPSQIRTLRDTETVTTALYGALNSEALGCRKAPDQLRNPSRWAIKTVDFGFGGEVDPDEQS
ncbi:hypothetical protein [Thermoleptolyngbya sp. C42_A2020_037]|uniref:hypothetical protein n=1 Tax=Thermoleptolyngbya sp. C42_A2020_037 TaxID=2747799 RepID=UPI0019F413AB|nr:hypothetical protein [Thermoleptolyngbya sp. C42_A2020_037]MBF2083421.1 hypothetical protein [Thermoleptolyngbya sp. C42_A2020_037]